MAAFCRNCGKPLAEGQGFCAGCGTPAGSSNAGAPGSPAPSGGVPAAAPPSAAPVAAPVAAAPVAAAPVAAAPAQASSGGAFVKILLIVVGIFFLFGAIGVASMVYIGYRVKQKARELGIDHRAFEEHESTLTGLNACNLVSKAEVSAAIGMEVTSTESKWGSGPSCTYFVKGDVRDLTAKHMSLMQKDQTDKKTQQMIEDMSKSMFHGMATTDTSSSDHPGEAPALVISVQDQGARLQMKLSKAALGNLGPVGAVAIPDLGDEAFDSSGAMLFVRKGEKLVWFAYTSCPCSRDELVPLARTAVGNL